MTKYLISGIAFMSCMHLFSQETGITVETITKTISRYEIGFQFSLPDNQGFTFLDADFRNFAPNFPDADSLATFQTYRDFNNYNPINSTLRLTYLLKPGKLYPAIAKKVSFNLGAGNNLFHTQYWENTNSVTYDTLVSQNTGEKYPLDSVIIEGHNRSISSRFASVGLGFHIEQKITKRFYMNYGIVALYNMQRSNFASTSYYRYGSSEWPSQETTNSSNTYSYITGSGPKIHSATISLPIEIRMYLSTKDNFWNHLSLGMNASPFAHFIQTEERSDRIFAMTAGASLTFRF